MHVHSYRTFLLTAVFAAAWATVAHAGEAPPLASACEPEAALFIKPAWAALAASQPAPEETWVDRSKHPVDWLKWGADVRLRNEYLNNVFEFNSNGSERNRERDFFRFRGRLWGTIAPCDAFEGNIRMTWEGRYYEQPTHSDPVLPATPGFDNQFYGGPIVFDNLNFKLNRLGDIPLSITVGRQDIILHDGWLVLDGTPLDGSRTIYFDAARFNLALKDIQSNLQLIYVDQAGKDDRWLHPIAWVDEDQIEQDERGAIVDYTYSGIKGTQLDGYFIYKHSEPSSRTTPYHNAGTWFNSFPDIGEVYTVGGRIAHKFDDHWSARVESAYQFGHKQGTELSAFGGLSRLTYGFNDAMKNQLKLNYEFMSGDHPGSATNEQFDPLWGRWPQFSELYVYSYAPETRIGEVTNLHRVGPGWQFEPIQRMQVLLDYNALFADQNPPKPFVEGDGYFRGHLVTGVVKYKFNRFLSGHLWGEVLVPGNFYSSTHQDTATFARAELVVTY